MSNPREPTSGAGKIATNQFPLRISTHVWHDADDVDALIDALKRLVPTIA